MALIKFSMGIGEMRGSVGGVTYSRNRYGAYARNRTKPVNPNTDRQTAIKAAMAFLTNRWSHTLTNLQRIAWDDYGAGVAMLNGLGEEIRLSGFNHYIRSNVIRNQNGISSVDDGPIDFTLPAQDPALAVTASEATQMLTVAYNAALDWANETGGFLFIYQGRPQNAQRNFFGGPHRGVGSVAGVDGAPPASPAPKAVAFAIAELQRQWIYARIGMADGRLSDPFRDNTFVAA